MKANNVWFLFIFLVLPIVYAVPPTQVSDYGLQIAVLPYEYHEQNKDFDFHAHIFLEADGTPLTIFDNCTLHIYNSSGSHIYVNHTNTTDDIYDVEFDLPANLFKNTGKFSYIIQCVCTGCGVDATDLGGFTRGEFTVTRTGYGEKRSLYYALGVLALCFFLVYFASTLGDNHLLIKILMNFIAVFWLMFYAAGILDAGTGDISFYKGVGWFVSIFVLYAFLYIMYNWLNYLGKLPKWAQKK